jgi:hypothetical protein
MAGLSPRRETSSDPGVEIIEHLCEETSLGVGEKVGPAGQTITRHFQDSAAVTIVS